MADPTDSTPTAGGAPPAVAPPPEVQDVVDVNLSFPPSPTAADICGFKIPPVFNFSISINIPFPNFKLPLPFNFSLRLSCDLSNPLDVEVSFGGGRKPTGTEGMQAEEIDF